LGQRARYALAVARDWFCSDADAGQPGRFPSLSPRTVGLLLLSAIPGAVPAPTLGGRRRARLLLLATLAALALAAVQYRSPLSNFILYTVLGLSLMSISATVDELSKRERGEPAGWWLRMGIALIVLSVYLSLYLIIRLALTPVLTTVNVHAQPWTESVASGDRLLLQTHGALVRGALVAGTTGVIRKPDIWGTAVAVVGPPAHRRRLDPVSIVFGRVEDDTR